MLTVQRTIKVVFFYYFLLANPFAVAEISDEKLAQAIKLMDENGIAYENKFIITRYLAYKNGGGLVSAQQLYKGLPVFYSEVVMHFDDKGKVIKNKHGSVFMGGNVIPIDDYNIDVEPAFSIEKAAEITIENSNNLDGASCLKNEKKRVTNLGVYKPNGVNQIYLAWQSKCKYKPNPSIIIDANSGEILGQAPGYIPQIPTRQKEN